MKDNKAEICKVFNDYYSSLLEEYVERTTEPDYNDKEVEESIYLFPASEKEVKDIIMKLRFNKSWW